MPIVEAARESTRRAQGVNNLKQFTLAAYDDHDTNGCFPRSTPFMVSPGTHIETGDGSLVAISPYLEQKALFDSVNFIRGCFIENAMTVRATRLIIFSCPSDGRMS